MGLGIAWLLLVCTLAFQICAQAEDTSCVNKLIPCLNYLNGTRDPPDTCCDPLKSVIKTNPDCLCSLISNQGSNRAERAGINVNEAQQLPGRCGEHVNPLSCLSEAATASAMASGLKITIMANAIISVIFQFL